MKTNILLIVGLLVGFHAADAWALCQEGTTSSCSLGNGCPGERECGPTGWGPCEPKSGTISCPVCGGTGTRQCDAGGSIISACTRPEQCNNCDDDADGQIDEGQVCNPITCGSTFEACGDGLDNDCDGAIDEGCSSCTGGAATTYPFNFGSIAEMRQDTDKSMGTFYGRRMDSGWRFLPSDRMSTFSLTFDQFAMEACCDFFFVNATSFTGSPMTPFITGTFNVSPALQTFLSFVSDDSVQKKGVHTTSINVKCNNGGGNTFNTIDLNEGADGVLLYTNDNAYVTFWLPAGREAFLSLDHNFGGSVDFDMFVTWNSNLFGTSCANSQICGFGAAASGEAVHLAADNAAGRWVKVNIHSWSGAGRYRLFVASPVASFSNDVDLAFDANVTPGSTKDLRAKSEWGQAQQTMMNATDGQFRIKEKAFITRDVSCFSCYDLVFSDQTSLGPPDCTPGMTTFGIGGWYIVLARPFWDGTSSWIDNATDCTGGIPVPTQSVANTIVHEWGHYDFDLDDERDASVRNRCGFSLMAGSGLADFTGGNQYFEFCGAGLHGMNPQPGAAAMGGNDNWTDIVSDYPAMSQPLGTGDFSQMVRLGEMMGAGSFVVFQDN